MAAVADADILTNFGIRYIIGKATGSAASQKLQRRDTMKRLLNPFLVAMIVLSLAGCGSTEPKTEMDTNPPPRRNCRCNH